jgi:hypothetical protein
MEAEICRSGRGREVAFVEEVKIAWPERSFFKRYEKVR